MRGEPATKVLLTIYRKDENRTFPVTIIREEIKQQSVRGKLVEPGYAWVRLNQFQERTVMTSSRRLTRYTTRIPTSKALCWTCAMIRAVC
jgi:carboxyl-terminal processing protease